MKKDLKYFILQYSVKKLYRDFMKTIYQSKDSGTRRELVELVKNEFMNNKNVENSSKIEYLLAIGRQKVSYIKNLIDMQS